MPKNPQPPQKRKGKLQQERPANQPSLFSFWGKKTTAPPSTQPPKPKNKISKEEKGYDFEKYSNKSVVGNGSNNIATASSSSKRKRVEKLQQPQGAEKMQTTSTSSPSPLNNDNLPRPVLPTAAADPRSTTGAMSNTNIGSPAPGRAEMGAVTPEASEEDFASQKNNEGRTKTPTTAASTSGVVCNQTSPLVNDDTTTPSLNETPEAMHQNNEDQTVIHVVSTTPKNDNNESDTESVGNNSDNEGDQDSPLQQQHDETPNNHYGLSEYELLRLRNIERNNERLKALGLWKPSFEDNTSAAAKRKRSTKKKKPVPQATAPTIATRRSTRRICKSVIDTSTTEFSRSIGTTGGKELPPMEEEPEEEIHYEVSPVVQYEMGKQSQTTNNPETSTESSSMSHSSSSTIADGNGSRKISSLVPMSLRLAPPQGLGAIYALQFYDHDPHWLVGAGKSGIVSLWNCRRALEGGTNNTKNNNDDKNDNGIDEDSDEDQYMDPIFTWKAHSGRWISDAQFLAPPAAASPSSTAPMRLVTAANDGTVCLWDLSKVSSTTGIPKLLQQSNKSWHSSGIFALDTTTTNHYNNNNGNPSTPLKIATGSKDKTVAIVNDIDTFCPTWRSRVHSAKIGAVRFRDDHVLATASDDGCVAVLDDRMKDGNGPPVALLEGLHNGRPHSVVWDRQAQESMFITAGLDSVIQAWDLRCLNSPVSEYFGHVPTSTRKCKRIHHPVFYSPSSSPDRFVLTGGEGSHSLSMFCCSYTTAKGKEEPITRSSVFSRGMLPPDCGGRDVGSIAIQQDLVAASVEGEVLLLKPPNKSCVFTAEE